MNASQHTKILARRPGDEFIGRESAFAELREHLDGSGQTAGLYLGAMPGCGTTELLLQAFDEAFRRSGGAVPVYFAFNGEAPVAAARRFAIEMLTQMVAYRLRDPLIIHSVPGFSEISRLAPAADIGLVDELIGLAERIPSPGDEASYIRACFSAPLRAAARGVRTNLFIDDLHLISEPSEGSDMAALVIETLEKTGARYVAVGRRRFHPATDAAVTRELEPLEAAHLATIFKLAACASEISDPVADLAALRSGGDVASLFSLGAGVKGGEPIDSFRSFEMLYTQAIFGGKLASGFDRVLRGICRSAEVESGVVRLLEELGTLGGSGVEIAAWRQKLGVDPSGLNDIVTRLNEEELIRVAGDRIEGMPENRIFNDYIKVRYRLNSGRETRAAVFAETLASRIRKAPAEMATHYRERSLVGLKELMSSFNGNSVPAALIDYTRFKAKYKGLSDAEIVERLGADDELIALPQIIFSAHTETFYRAIGLITERERSAIAVGFEQGDLGGENRTAWIAAEIESKLEVSAETAVGWCDRLEMAAAVSGFTNYRIWLVSPEGFNEDALRLMSQRGAFGSSRRQAELLSRELSAKAERGETVAEQEAGIEEYEIVIPMGGEAEMVAAHTVEDIARRHDISPKAINQIKTALVEACINATEHSLSPDRRIHQRFVVRPGSITITVSNRGIRLTDKPRQMEPDEGRRGWGLKLMRNLMDDVRIEAVDDGTRISMTKHF